MQEALAAAEESIQLLTAQVHTLTERLEESKKGSGYKRAARSSQLSLSQLEALNGGSCSNGLDHDSSPLNPRGSEHGEPSIHGFRPAAETLSAEDSGALVGKFEQLLGRLEQQESECRGLR